MNSLLWRCAFPGEEKGLAPFGFPSQAPGILSKTLLSRLHCQCEADPPDVAAWGILGQSLAVSLFSGHHGSLLQGEAT